MTEVIELKHVCKQFDDKEIIFYPFSVTGTKSRIEALNIAKKTPNSIK